MQIFAWGYQRWFGAFVAELAVTVQTAEHGLRG
jgi:hypothetical protein